MTARHNALAVLIAAVWGVNFVVIHAGLAHFPPLFSALRFTFVAFPAVLLVGRPRVRWYWVVAIGGSLGVLSFGLLFVGIDQGMPAGLSSLVLQSQVIFTVAFAALALGERPRRTQVVGGPRSRSPAWPSSPLTARARRRCCPSSSSSPPPRRGVSRTCARASPSRPTASR